MTSPGKKKKKAHRIVQQERLNNFPKLFSKNLLFQQLPYSALDGYSQSLVFFLTGLTVFHVVILVFLFCACLITRGDALFPNHENFRGSTPEWFFLLSNSVTSEEFKFKIQKNRNDYQKAYSRTDNSSNHLLNTTCSVWIRLTNSINTYMENILFSINSWNKTMNKTDKVPYLWCGRKPLKWPEMISPSLCSPACAKPFPCMLAGCSDFFLRDDGKSVTSEIRLHTYWTCVLEFSFTLLLVLL